MAKNLAKKVMKMAVKSTNKKCDRKYNVVIFNVDEEQEDGNTSKHLNNDRVRQLQDCQVLKEIFRLSSSDEEFTG